MLDRSCNLVRYFCYIFTISTTRTNHKNTNSVLRSNLQLNKICLSKYLFFRPSILFCYVKWKVIKKQTIVMYKKVILQILYNGLDGTSIKWKGLKIMKEFVSFNRVLQVLEKRIRTYLRLTIPIIATCWPWLLHRILLKYKTPTVNRNEDDTTFYSIKYLKYFQK